MTEATEILALEREFWTAMAAGDHERSARLIANESALVHSTAVITFTPATYIRMGAESPFKIKDWELTDERVVFPTADSALCTYKVRQTVEHHGQTETTLNHDTSVWVRDGSDWKCVLHSEIPALDEARGI